MKKQAPMEHQAHTIKQIESLQKRFFTRNRRIQNAYVYAILFKNKQVKVGCSTRPNQRITELATRDNTVEKMFVVLTGDYENVEKMSLDDLVEHRLYGEYFDCSFDLAVSVVRNNSVPIRCYISHMKELRKAGVDQLRST